VAFLVVGSKLRPRVVLQCGRVFHLGGWSVKIRPGHGRQHCGKLTIKGNPRLVSVGLCKWAFVPE
jgi:hypothetical protein